MSLVISTGTQLKYRQSINLWDFLGFVCVEA